MLRLLQRAVVSVILKLLWVLSYVEDIAGRERERECVVFYNTKEGNVWFFLKEVGFVGRVWGEGGGVFGIRDECNHNYIKNLKS